MHYWPYQSCYRELHVIPTKIVPQKRLHNPHPLVRRTRAKLEKCKPDKYGAIGAWGKQCLDLRIAPNSIDRALRIMDSLIKAFEKYGYTVGSDTEWNNHPNSYVMIFGEKVKFSIYEGSIQSLDKKWNEEDYFSSHHKYKYRMSGKLQFQLDGRYSRGIRNKWSDTVRKQIEDCLRDVLIGAIKLAHFACAERERREEEARRWEEERIRRAEEQRRHEEEMKRRSELENQALSWNKSKQLRKFIAEVERKVSMQMCSVNDQTRMIEWLAWAKEHADRIDPLYDNLPFEVDS